jgi:hypothetical protein
MMRKLPGRIKKTRGRIRRRTISETVFDNVFEALFVLIFAWEGYAE